MEGGKVVRSAVAGVPAKGRDTMGVIFAKPDKNDRIIAVARNANVKMRARWWVLWTRAPTANPQSGLPWKRFQTLKKFRAPLSRTAPDARTS